MVFVVPILAVACPARARGAHSPGGRADHGQAGSRDGAIRAFIARLALAGLRVRAGSALGRDLTFIACVVPAAITRSVHTDAMALRVAVHGITQVLLASVAAKAGVAFALAVLALAVGFLCAIHGLVLSAAVRRGALAPDLGTVRPWKSWLFAVVQLLNVEALTCRVDRLLSLQLVSCAAKTVHRCQLAFL